MRKLNYSENEDKYGCLSVFIAFVFVVAVLKLIIYLIAKQLI